MISWYDSLDDADGAVTVAAGAEIVMMIGGNIARSRQRRRLLTDLV